MGTTESHLRCHLRPYFGRRQLRQITPSIALRWQNELEGKLSHSGVMACRSILLRILEEFGRFLAACRPFYRDHFLAQVGTGLRRRRAYPELRRIEVIEVRYEAGRFGRGFKAEPKSPASVRVVPMCEQVRQAIGRQLPPAPGPTIWCSPAPAAATASMGRQNLAVHPQPATRLPGRGRRRRRGPGPPGPARPTRPAPHLRDVARRCRHSLRVTDELMGHTGGRRNGGAGGSPMGRVYRETTPAMLARVTAALDERIGRAMGVVRSPLRDAEGSAGAQAGRAPAPPGAPLRENFLYTFN
jgi:Phage integrase, N-terminal SAM-like domain